MGGKQKPNGIIVGTAKKPKLLILDSDGMLKIGSFISILR
jgi:hypothetical protein